MMLLWSLIAFWRENGRFEWAILVKRFRLEKPNRQTILWGIGLSLVMLGAQLIFSALLAGWIESGLVKIPESIPSYVNPTYQQSFGEMKAQFAAEGIFGIIPIVLLFNIVGEEFLWRGYALPRQELAYRKYTWVLQGILWSFSHAFQYWLIPQLLIGALALTYLSQRQKSTWVGIIGHAINNSLPIIVLALM
jgi:membrane protease YdiL (CAAX protease family)